MATYYQICTGMVDEFIDPEMKTESLAGINAVLAQALAAEPSA